MTYPVTPDPQIHHVPASIQKTQAGTPIPIEQVTNFATGLLNAIVSKVVHIVTFGLVPEGAAYEALTKLEDWWGGFLSDVHHALTWSPNLPEINPSTVNDIRVSDVAAAARFTRRDATRGITELIPQSRIPSIPVSHLGADSPNLLVGGGFDAPANFDVSTSYVWDGTVGRTGVGSAKATGNGSSQIIYSNSIAVLSGDEFTLGGWVKWSNVYSSGTAIQLAVVAYAGTSAVYTTVIGSVSGLAANASATWTNLSGTWSYSGTVPTSVDNIRLKLIVSDLVTAGTVWWDDISAYKTGILTGTLVSGIASGSGTIVDDLQGTVDGIHQGVNGGTATGNALTSVKANINTVKSFATNLQTSLVQGYQVVTVSATGPWLVPDNISEIYVALFGGGGKGLQGSAGTSTGPYAGGAGGVAGGFVAQQLDPATVTAGTYIGITIGQGTSTGGQDTYFGSLVSTNSAFKSYVASPLGLLTTGAGPTAGGTGGASGSGGGAAPSTVVGVVGGSGGSAVTAAASGQLPGASGGGSGNNGINFDLCYTGGSGGGGGGGVNASFSGSATGGAGGSGGAPGGGGGGGGGVRGSAVYGPHFGGPGGNGGQGLILIIYKTAST